MESSAAGKGAKAPKPVMRRKVKEIIRRFIFDPAPMGKSAVAFPIIEKGQVVRLPSGEIKMKMLPLTDKVATMSKTMSKVNYITMKGIFLEMGFRQDDRAVYGQEEVILKPEDVPIVKKFVYKFGHPDNSPEEKIDAELGIGIEGETIKLKFVKGFVEVEDPRVVEALELMGMYLVSRTPIEDKEEPGDTEPPEPPTGEGDDNGSGQDNSLPSIVKTIGDTVLAKILGKDETGSQGGEDPVPSPGDESIGPDENFGTDEELQLDPEGNNAEFEGEEL